MGWHQFNDDPNVNGMFKNYTCREKGEIIK